MNSNQSVSIRSASIRSVRGHKDWAGDTAELISSITLIAQQVFAKAGYQPVYLPCLERTELFTRGVGEHTDIVEKELYSFTDRNDDRLSLRPEGTAGLVRAINENGWLQQGEIGRFQYFGSMFRRERPQRGRYRQFKQFGAEAFGSNSAAVDAELIGLSMQWFDQLGLLPYLSLNINNLGNIHERQRYRQALVDFLKPNQHRLDADSQKRLTLNPLRILDSKCQQTQELLALSPQLDDFIEAESRQHFEQLKAYLHEIGVHFEINPQLVRGLDYYNLSVFEWQTDQLGSQGTVCGGGRYDGLSEMIGGRPMAACGFAAGIERIVELFQHINPKPSKQPKIYIVAEANLAPQSLWLAQQIRKNHPSYQVLSDVQFGSFKSQLKKADKQLADFAIILAGNEWQHKQFIIKPLRNRQLPQQTIRMDGLNNVIRQLMDG